MAEDFEALVERGVQAAHALDFGPATAAYLAALALRPDNAPVVAALGLVLLAQGRYAEGFALYEARKLFEAAPVGAAGLPEWQGEDLEGRRLLIWPEQGLGDEIQMARYARLLGGAREIVLACSPPLARLFGQLGVTVFPIVEGAPTPRADLWVRSFSLPARLETTLETIPPAPYLRAPPGPKTGGVGFVWRGNPEHPNDARRSLPSPAVLDPLHEVAELVDLQAPQGDFLGAAARIQGLDLVISVDTAMAHLAGALGVPCWVMLPAYRTDWRWMAGRDDSPWYPSLKLYRQPADGDWDSVVARMAQDLG